MDKIGSSTFPSGPFNHELPQAVVVGPATQDPGNASDRLLEEMALSVMKALKRRLNGQTRLKITINLLSS